MNYSIRKPKPDSRHNTCGFALEDESVVVVEYNKHIAARLENVEAFGYLVDQTNVDPGTYSEEDFDSKHTMPKEHAKSIEEAKWTIPRSKRGSART